MKIILIAAKSTNQVIGKNNQLPWHLPADLRFFENTIRGASLITGRKSYESPQGTALFTANRSFVVLTQQVDYVCQHGQVATSLASGLQIVQATGAKEVFILGGATVYEQAMAIADQLVITEVHAIVEGDTFFPVIDLVVWKERSREDYEVDEAHEYGYSFVVYERRTTKKMVL